jgi:hypothetical protein
MMRLRSESLMAAQLAISSMVRPQPRQKPVSVSSVQMSMQGVCKWMPARLIVPPTNVGADGLYGNSDRFLGDLPGRAD